MAEEKIKTPEEQAKEYRELYRSEFVKKEVEGFDADFSQESCTSG
ncbi:hypothetical protein ACF3NX_06445 [Acetobacter orientalis]